MAAGDRYDLMVIGGGINGCGIARDAAGRGLAVLLVERDDLAAHTSSASTKLIHGGLRYLEYGQFRLVRESLAEREVLLGIAPHLVRPMRFVMPLGPATRPAWMLRAGLWLYDHLGGRSSLPRSAAVHLAASPLGGGLKWVTRGFAYSDCWVDDARLVVLNALAAHEAGAHILTRVGFLGAERAAQGWRARLSDGRQISARAIVNAAGPWVGTALASVAGARPERPPRLIKGSHIVVPRLFAGEHAYILQNDDRRIVFAIPYEGDFTLVGTTDISIAGDPAAPQIAAAEVAYLCRAINRYFATPIAAADVVASFAGVRPLFDDGAADAADAAAITRDYVLRLDAQAGAPLLSVFGGKLTTYRRLAEQALAKLAPYFPGLGGAWTGTVPLPGGDLGGQDFAAFLAAVRARWPFLAAANAERMARAYGTRIGRVLGDAARLDDLGGGLSAREVAYLARHEWAITPEDVLWRRSKIGLHTGAETRRAVAAVLAETLAED